MSIISKPHGDFTNNVDVANATYVNDQMNTAYNAINGGLDSTNVPTLGDVTTLITSAKGSSVAAINEIFGYPTNSVTRQSVINGGFSVNQRVVSGTVTLTAGQYGHDRWKAGASGCAYTFATSANITTITITAGSLIQVIEGLNLFSGTYTLSWTGTAQGKIGAGSYGASGLTGTVTGGTNLSIEFNTGTLSKVGFNIGGIALPFQPRSFADELALCQRYYEKSYDYGTAPMTSALPGIEAKIVSSNTILNNSPYGKVSYKVNKRVTPTITIYPYTAPSNTGRVSANSGADLGAFSGAVNLSGISGFDVYNGSGGSLTTTETAVIFHWSSDAEL